jgi:hypothetical protein
MEADRPQYDRPAACYRPAVFFRHLRLIVFSFPKEKVRRALQTLKFHFFFFFTFLQNALSLKLRNLNFR